ncbi:MAG TPA: ATP-binding protein [Blastocatellia bacterium]|nr:ATP-binding protein [Blastocatellia bacterium]
MQGNMDSPGLIAGAVWVIAIITILIRGIWISTRFQSQPRSDEEAIQWGRQLVLNGFFAAVAWGASSWIFLPAASLQQEAWLIVGIAMVLMAGAGVQAFYHTMVTTFVISIVTVFTSGLIRIGDPFHVTLALAYPLYGYAVLMFARNQEKAIRAAILLGFEKEALVRDITAQNQAAQSAQREAEEARQVAERAQHETQQKTDALITAKEELRSVAEQQNLAKSKFLAEAAHDLRQPMQALTNLLDATTHALDRRDLDKGAELLGLAQHAAQLTRSSLGAVLEISRLESGFVKAEYSSFDIQELLDEVLAPYLILAGERRVKVRVRRSGHDKVTVRSDRHLLARVIGNLISNAIKYSDTSKRDRAAVLVGVVCFSNRARIDIVDNGIGIAKNEWANVFKPFVQLRNPERDRDKGVGLGLSIVSAVIHLLAGHRIDMTSAEGRGTRFSLEVPLAEAPADRSEDPLHRLPTITSVAGTYVLYVEDDPLVRTSTIAIFEAHEILYEAFASVAELEQKLPSLDRLPDIVITDYRLPDALTAEDVVRVTKSALGVTLPTLVITGEVLPFERPAWLESGRILRKPISAQKLITEIGLFCSAQEYV